MPPITFPRILAVFGAALSLFFTYALMSEAMGEGGLLGVIAFALFLQTAQYVYTLPQYQLPTYFKTAVAALYLLSVAATYGYLQQSLQTFQQAHAAPYRAAQHAYRQHTQQLANANTHLDRARRDLDTALDEHHRTVATFREAARKQVEKNYAQRAADTLATQAPQGPPPHVADLRQAAADARAARDHLTTNTPQEPAQPPAPLLSQVPPPLRAVLVAMLAMVLELVVFISLQQPTTQVKRPTYKPVYTPKPPPKTPPKPQPAPTPKPREENALVEKILSGHYGPRPTIIDVVDAEKAPREEVSALFTRLRKENKLLYKSKRYTLPDSKKV